MTTTVFAVLVSIILLHENPVSVPRWAADKLAGQISRQTGSVSLKDTRVLVSFNSNWRPQLTFDALILKHSNGQASVKLSRLDAVFSLRQAIKGELDISELYFDGLVVEILRDEQGDFQAQLGTTVKNMGYAAKPSNLKLEFDQIFETPLLNSFRSLTVQNVTLDYIDRRSSRNWTVDGGRLFVTKERNRLSVRSDLALLTGGTGVSIIEANYNTELGKQKVDFGIKFSDLPSDILASQSKGFEWLAALDAPISGALRGSLDSNGELGSINTTLDISAGALQPDISSKPLKFSSLKTYFTYDPVRQALAFDNVILKSSDLSFSAEGNAFVEVGENEEGGLIGQFRLNNISANPLRYYKSSKKIDFATVEFRLFLDPFEVQLEQIYITDIASDLEARGSARFATDEGGWSIFLQAELDKLNYEGLMAYWPRSINSEQRTWVATNIREAKLSNVIYALNYKSKSEQIASLAFAFRDTSFRPVKAFPIVKQAAGLFSSFDNRLAIIFEQGKLYVPKFDTVDIAGTEFVIPTTKTIPSPSNLKLVGKGSLKAVVNMLNNPPISVFKSNEKIFNSVDGVIEFKADLDFPLKKELTAEEMSYLVDGMISELAVPNFNGQEDIYGNKVDLELTSEILTLNGVINALGTQFSSKLLYNLATQKVVFDADFDIDQSLIDAINFPLPPKTLFGKSTGTVHVEAPKGSKVSIDIVSDLIGLGLSIPGLKWSKPVDLNGNLIATATFEDGLNFESFSLDTNGLRLNGKPMVTSAGDAAGFDIDEFKIDERINVSGIVEANKRITIKKGYFDARPFFVSRKRKIPTSSETVPARIDLDRVRLTKDAVLTNFIGDLQIGAALVGDFTADMGERAKITGSFYSRRGKTAVEIRSDQGGPVLKEFGVVKDATGGKLLASLTPAKDEMATDGYVRVDDVKIQGAPFLAELLNAISIVGLIETLSGPGIPLNEIEATFRIKEDQIILKDFYAFGPSMGITLDGYYSTTNKTLDMQGVISPIYVLNGVGAIMSKKGEGLIGFNFNLKGKTGDVKLSVNPLSALTPAMFRNIFRRPPPEYDE